tara:strand:- start:373 stop:900 length:528 start_codon:yes stop_codon:yes gene_type:complete
MALWGNNDNLTSAGTVTLNYGTGVVTGAGTSFGTVGAGGTGDVIRFGDRSGTYFGDAVIVSIANTQSVTIGSTAGLSGAAISGANFTVTQCPKYTVLDSKYSEASYGTEDSFVYGISTSGSQAALTSAYEVGTGWVGVTTYVDTHGNLRVKKEILVAMSGIQTGNAPVYDADPTA